MVEMEATKAISATVTVFPAAQVDDPKKISKNPSASWIFFSLSSLFGTPAKIHGYCEIKIIYSNLNRKSTIILCIPMHDGKNQTRTLFIGGCRKMYDKVYLTILHRIVREQISKN